MIHLLQTSRNKKYLQHLLTYRSQFWILLKIPFCKLYKGTKDSCCICCIYYNSTDWLPTVKKVSTGNFQSSMALATIFISFLQCSRPKNCAYHLATVSVTLWELCLGTEGFHFFVLWLQISAISKAHSKHARELEVQMGKHFGSKISWHCGF